MQTGSVTIVSRASARRPNFVFDPRRTTDGPVLDLRWMPVERGRHPGRVCFDNAPHSASMSKAGRHCAWGLAAGDPSSVQGTSLPSL
jgi:hypothetical protein